MDPSYLPVIRTITNPEGSSFAPCDEMRILSPLSAEVVTGDGPDRIELSVAGGVVTSVTATLPIVVTGSGARVVAINPATDSLPGSMSAADKTKLDGIGEGATVTNVGVNGALTLGGTGAFPIVGIEAASDVYDGSMSSGDYSDLHGATSTADPSRIVRRDNQASAAFYLVQATGLAVGGESSTFASDIGLTPYDDTYAASLSLAGRDGGRHDVTLTGNITFLAPTMFAEGSSLEVFVTQGSGGSKAATWATGLGGFSFPTGLSGTLIATTAGDVDYFEFKHRPRPTSHWVCVAHLKYSPP